MTPNTCPSSAERDLRIYLVDDQPLVRESLRDMLNGTAGLRVAGEAATFEEAMALFRQSGAPDVGVINLTLRRRSGLQLIKELVALYPGVRLLALSMYDEHLYALRALRAGAKGYLMKTVPPKEIIAALRQICAGQLVVSAGVRERVMTETAETSDAAAPDVRSLTDDELATLECLGKGMTTTDAAQVLRMTLPAMRVQCEKMKAKLGCANMRELILAAIRFVRQYEI